MEQTEVVQKKRGPKPKSEHIEQTIPGPSGINALIEIGIPLSMARFHQTVLSYGNSADANGTPEVALYASIQRLSRKANMWYTPHGLVVEQRGKYKIIPLAQVADTLVL